MTSLFLYLACFYISQFPNNLITYLDLFVVGIRLTFDDSTITPAQQALAEGELSVFETYETEYALIHRPVFSWIKNDSVAIAPGRKVTLTINCFGKVGCTEGTIHTSYSYIHRNPDDDGSAKIPSSVGSEAKHVERLLD
ncbi:hypothetical protein DFJ43DRAFT_1151295 [Lentinula guzmanii]|uniref:Uncharacterized protein n=1 Tax=Lentinula guzmanii TaxID=2804957 RepID=A0AA38JR88_9AGAR|nr:hypothetical protein DFJ43DRAFT_1151295 [Lentinula guzmanii]